MKHSQNLFKTVLFAITLTTACGAKSQTANSNTSGDSSREEGQTTFVCEGDGTQVPELIQEILAEVNFVRQNPVGYAEKLRENHAHFLSIGSEPEIQDAIRELMSTQPRKPLQLSSGLSLAALELVVDQGPKGSNHHNSSNGDSPFDRMDHHGKWGGSAGENISFGMSTAEDIVAQLVIDPGPTNTAKQHRKNLLNPKFTRIGLAYGAHATYKTMCVMDLASQYVEAK